MTQNRRSKNVPKVFLVCSTSLRIIAESANNNRMRAHL